MHSKAIHFLNELAVVLCHGTYCEKLLGLIVLIEVDTGSAVLLQAITGQQLSGEGKHTHRHRNTHTDTQDE